MFLWLISVFQFSVNELLVGATASALAAFALHAALKAVPLCFEPRLRWLLEVRHLPRLIAQDLWTVFLDLGRRLGRNTSQGVWRQSHFEAAHDCRGDAQRALATLFISLTPNSVVLDMDRSNSILFFHELVAAPLPRYLRNLQDE